MSDQFQSWRDRIEGKEVPIVTDQPQPGYYKMRDGKDGPWVPVAIWETDYSDEGGTVGLHCRVGSKNGDPMHAWSWCAKHPIDKALAKKVFETGRWPDMPNDIPLSNMPSDPYEALLAEINDKMDQANSWLSKHDSGASSQIEADWARNLEAQIQDLIKRSNKMHTEEKAPHLASGRAVDQRFAFRKDMDPIKKRLKSAWGTFAAAEERRLRAEAEAKAAAERKRVEEERARIEAEQKKLMDEDPIAALTSEPEPLPEMPKVEEVKVNVGGGVGSRGGLTTVWKFEIEDYFKAMNWFAQQPAYRTDIRALIDKCARDEAKQLKAEARAPGVRFYSERVAK